MNSESVVTFDGCVIVHGDLLFENVTGLHIYYSHDKVVSEKILGKLYAKQGLKVCGIIIIY